MVEIPEEHLRRRVVRIFDERFALEREIVETEAANEVVDVAFARREQR